MTARAPTPGETTPPAHHVRYARAWALHQDPGTTDTIRGILEREMDSAQNLFGWDEFQAFKAMLPGFVEFWDGWKDEVLNEIAARQR